MVASVNAFRRLEETFQDEENVLRNRQRSINVEDDKIKSNQSQLGLNKSKLKSRRRILGELMLNDDRLHRYKDWELPMRIQGCTAPYRLLVVLGLTIRSLIHYPMAVQIQE